MKIGIGQGIGRKKRIDQDMMIGIDQSIVMIANIRIVGMTIGETIIDGTIIGVMTNIMDIIGKMTDKITISAIVETIMNRITHPDGIIMNYLIRVVDIKTTEFLIIIEVMATLDHQIVDLMIIESRKDLDISSMILEIEIILNLKILIVHSMKTASRSAHRSQIATFGGKMATMLTNAQQKKKAKHWQLI